MTSVALDGPAQFLHLEYVFHGPLALISLFFQCEDVILQVCVGVRLKVREENDVVVVLKSVAEG